MDLVLADLFQNGCVLQRDQPIPLWGRATPGALVEVRLAHRHARVEAGPEGAWLLRLAPLPAGGPHRLEVRAGGDALTLDDLLIGEVWLCAGQSNMEWTPILLDPENRGPAVAADPLLRLRTVTTPARLGRHAAIAGRWEVADAAALRRFSAVGAWFGQRLRRELGVPVGLVCVAWGGTRIQAWMSRESLAEDPSGGAELRTYDAELFDPAVQRPGYVSFAEWERLAAPKDPGRTPSTADWHRPDHDDAGWEVMALPATWQERGHPHSGIAWFRRTVAVPPGWAGQDLFLDLGVVDKHDDTWVAGERVGGIGWEVPDAWSTRRQYRVPGRLVGQDGRLSVAVRVRSHVFGGGLVGPAQAMSLRPAAGGAEAVALAGDWRCRFEADWGQVALPTERWGAGNPNTPHILYDSRIAPLIPFGLRGVIWYQGEANVSEHAQHGRQLRSLIRDWRRAWGQGDMPFLQVQLAAFLDPQADPVPSQWAALREAQASALALPAVGLAVAIDVGDASDIHPKDKRSVGERLARWALAGTYHRAIVPSGPLLSAVTLEPGGRLRCRFLHGEGLATSDGGPVRQVALRDYAKRWRWAETAIDGDALVAWLPDEPAPTAIRYAWADNPAGAHLINGAGLPAAPFRTDEEPS
jgi:sialate O-acetylesterase